MEETMLKKSTNIWILLSIILTFIVLIIGKNTKDLVISCGLAEATTWEKLTALNIPVNHPENIICQDNEENDIYGILVDINQETDLIHRLKTIPLVVIASPVNQLEYNNTTLGQKVVIEKVLQGDKRQLGKTITIYQYSPFQIREGNIYYETQMTFLTPNEKYVLFSKTIKI